MAVQDRLKDLFIQTIQTTFDRTLESVIFESPKDPANGDLACPVAFALAKSLRKAPKIIAEALVDAFPKDPVYDHLSVAGGGFINIILSPATLLEVVDQIHHDFEAFSHSDVGHTQSILLEFVSVNPTGIMHIGHARGAASGDTLSRILKKAGFNVVKEYYVNDAGNQMKVLAKSLYVRYLQALGRDAVMPEEGYHGPDIIALAAALKATYSDQWVDHDDALETFKKLGLDALLSEIKTDLERADVTFDSFFHESTLYEDGHVDDVLTRLKASGYTYMQEGALYLKTSLKGDEKDRVLVKSSGDYTYILPDIAYHEHKIKRGFTSLIDLLGTDHHGYIARLKAALSILGYDDVLDVLLIQLVRVIRDGKEVKMSKRSGQSLSLRDLLDEVGKDPIRYFFAARSLNTHMDLDLNLAEKQRSENPVYYVQYAHARIASLLKKARDMHGEKEVKPPLTTVNIRRLKPLLNHLSAYKETIEKAALTKEIHKLPNYLHELASLFHKWYSDEKLITEVASDTHERVYVLTAIQTVLADGLNLIGVDAPHVM